MKTWKNIKTGKKTEDMVEYIDRRTGVYHRIFLISVLVLFTKSRNKENYLDANIPSKYKKEKEKWSKYCFDFSCIIILCACSSVKDTN